MGGRGAGTLGSEPPAPQVSTGAFCSGAGFSSGGGCAIAGRASASAARKTARSLATSVKARAPRRIVLSTAPAHVGGNALVGFAQHAESLGQGTCEARLGDAKRPVARWCAGHVHARVASEPEQVLHRENRGVGD